MTRRRLDLLPEVLPAPPSRGDGGPRQRALRSMQRLLALAATGATVGACAKATPPGAASGAPSAAELAPAVDASAASPRPTGYHVVDPMPGPPPFRCPGVEAGVHGTAEWHGEIIRLRAGRPADGTRFEPSTLSVVSGTIRSQHVTSSAIDVEIAPDGAASRCLVSIDLGCSAGVQHLRFVIAPDRGSSWNPGSRLHVWP